MRPLASPPSSHGYSASTAAASPSCAAAVQSQPELSLSLPFECAPPRPLLRLGVRAAQRLRRLPPRSPSRYYDRSGRLPHQQGLCETIIIMMMITGLSSSLLLSLRHSLKRSGLRFGWVLGQLFRNRKIGNFPGFNGPVQIGAPPWQSMRPKHAAEEVRQVCSDRHETCTIPTF